MADLTVGPVVTPADVEEAVRRMLETDFDWYLAEVDEQHNEPRGTVSPPRLYVARGDNERWAEETPPVLVVSCPGTIGAPVRHGDRGSYGAWWQVNVAVTVGGATEKGSRALASRHLGALILALAQQPDIGGLAEDTSLQGARVDFIPPQRTLIACEAVFGVYIARIVDTRGLIPRDLPDDISSVPATPVPTRLRVTVSGNDT